MIPGVNVRVFAAALLFVDCDIGRRVDPRGDLRRADRSESLGKTR